jgi:uncharacterized protein RhaS with RHS repeats
MRVIASDPGERPRVRKKVVTTTFTYDNNGNVTQKTVDGTTTTYVYDYTNRLPALGVGGATTTYAYDAFGQRVLQGDMPWYSEISTDSNTSPRVIGVMLADAS